ncbi:hypothetical protein D3C85_1117900 [compost metagenome]
MLGIEPHAIGQHLNPIRHSRFQGLGVGTIDFLCRPNRIDPGEVHAVQLHCADALARQASQFTQVLGAPLRDSIRKRRHRCAIEAQCHALDLDECVPIREIQAEIHPAALLAVGHFTLEPGKAGQLGDQAGVQCFFNQRIGSAGIDARQPPLRGFADFPGTGQLAFGVIGTAEPDLATFAHAVMHRAGIGAVNRDLLTTGQFDIG